MSAPQGHGVTLRQGALESVLGRPYNRTWHEFDRIRKALLPVTTSREVDPRLLAALRLALVDGVGPRIRQALLDRFETAEAVFAAPQSALMEIDGVGPKIAAAIVAARHS